MTQVEFLEKYQMLAGVAAEITKRKNADYSKTKDAFANFQLVEYLGVTDTATGIMVRMCDKVIRISNLIKTEGKVKDESITDTLIDLANYSLILAVWINTNKGGV